MTASQLEYFPTASLLDLLFDYDCMLLSLELISAAASASTDTQSFPPSAEWSSAGLSIVVAGADKKLGLGQLIFKMGYYWGNP